VGGRLDQATGAVVSGESVSLGFLPIAWGAPSLAALIGAVLVCWLLSLLFGWLLMLLFPNRMLRIAATASRRSGASIVLGLISAPLVVVMIGLLVVTVI